MANKMLIDATHPEETRVVVLRGNRVEEFDFESATRKQLRGNIYLAKVTRVEPSLQAAFVDYGGNRHGFLAFSEIHPDYYQIPVADRQALIDEDQRAQRDADDEIDRRSRRHRGDNRRSAARRGNKVVRSDLAEGPEADPGSAEHAAEAAEAESSDEHAADFSAQSDFSAGATEETSAASESDSAEHIEQQLTTGLAPSEAEPPESAAEPEPENASFESTVAVSETVVSDVESDLAGEPADHPSVARESTEDGDGEHGDAENGDNGEEVVESVGGADALEEVPDRAPRYRRQYKIQEVIKRRQVMLVQVVKEERGTKGAALTTYLSLAGRYSVLMPNTARGGG